MKTFANIIHRHPNLTSLNFGWNKINDGGIEALVETLPKSTNLLNLNISCNNMGESGLKAFLHVLPQFSSLVNLDLSNNDSIAKYNDVIAKNVASYPNLIYYNTAKTTNYKTAKELADRIAALGFFSEAQTKLVQKYKYAIKYILLNELHSESSVNFINIITGTNNLQTVNLAAVSPEHHAAKISELEGKYRSFVGSIPKIYGAFCEEMEEFLAGQEEIVKYYEKKNQFALSDKERKLNIDKILFGDGHSNPLGNLLKHLGKSKFNPIIKYIFKYAIDENNTDGLSRQGKARIIDNYIYVIKLLIAELQTEFYTQYNQMRTEYISGKFDPMKD